MARVSLTERNINHILNNVRSIYDKDLQAAFSQDPTIWSEAIYDALVPIEYRAHMEQLPEYYFVAIKNLRVIPFGVNRIEIKAEWPEYKLFPRAININGCEHALISSQYAPAFCLDEPTTSRIDPLVLNYIRERENKICNILSKKDAAVLAARTFLSQHKTLAPAIKEWPALWNILPSDIREQHTRVDERSPRKPKQEPVKVDVDLSSVTARVISARLKGEIK